jgi:hypothetical protein
MDIQRYIFDLIQQYPRTQIKPVISELLLEFTHELTSAYQVYKNIKREDNVYGEDYGSTSYKNTNVKIRKLLDIGFVQIKKKTNTKHRAIYYNLTSTGIFYLFLTGLTLHLDIQKLVKNYRNDGLFKTLLYPYFEIKTLTSIRSFTLTQDIKLYLTACCKIIYQKIGIARALEKNAHWPIFSWEELIQKKSFPKLLSYLQSMFDLTFGLDPVVTTRDSIITIKGPACWCMIRMNEAKTKALIFKDNTVLSEFDVRPSKNMSDFDLYYSKFSVKSFIAEEGEWVRSRFKQEYVKFLVTWVFGCEEDMDNLGKLIRDDIKSDLALLSSDKKFIAGYEEISSSWKDNLEVLFGIKN